MNSMEKSSRVGFPAFKVKVLEQVRETTKKERQEILTRCDYNLFLIPAEDVMIDFLTDSGTGALSNKQMAVMQLGDESYACSNSWYKFKTAVADLFHFKHIIPTHQGRAAERILFSAMVEPGMIVPNNTHFDTTKANIEMLGATACNLPIKESQQRKSAHPFKGNCFCSYVFEKNCLCKINDINHTVHYRKFNKDEIFRHALVSFNLVICLKRLLPSLTYW